MNNYVILFLCSFAIILHGGGARNAKCNNSEEGGESCREANGNNCSTQQGVKNHGATWWDGNFKYTCDKGEIAAAACKATKYGISYLTVGSWVILNGAKIMCPENEYAATETKTKTCKTNQFGITKLTIYTTLTLNDITMVCREGELGGAELQTRNSKCPFDWKSAKYGCYKAVDKKMNWADAKAKCKELNSLASLPWFNDEEEFKEFVDIAKTLEGNRKWVWLEMKDENLEKTWAVTRSNGDVCAAKVFHWRNPSIMRNKKCAIHNTQLSEDWRGYSCSNTYDVQAICKIPLNDPVCAHPTTTSTTTTTTTTTTTKTPDKCPAGWLATPSACYKLIREGATLSQAKEKCKKENPRAVLPWFNDEWEYNDFKDTRALNGSHYGYWMAMHGMNKWEVTMSNGAKCPSKVFHWSPNYPKSTSGNDCPEIWNYNDAPVMSNSMSCNNNWHVLCQIRFNDYYCMDK